MMSSFMMSLFNSAFENFKEKFRKIEKLSRKCVNLQGAIVYIYIYIVSSIIYEMINIFTCMVKNEQ